MTKIFFYINQHLTFIISLYETMLMRYEKQNGDIDGFVAGICWDEAGAHHNARRCNPYDRARGLWIRVVIMRSF